MLALAKQYDEDDFQAYIQQWYDNDGWSDLSAFIDGDYLELAIDHLISAGAIDPNLSSEPEIERSMIEYMKGYTQKHRERDLDECLDGYHVYKHKETNETAFIGPHDCMSEAEMNNLGYELDFIWKKPEPKLTYSQKKSCSKYLTLILEKDVWTKQEIQGFKNLVNKADHGWIKEPYKSIVLDLADKFERLSKSYQITQEQTEFGIDWLNRVMFKKNGQLRDTKLICGVFDDRHAAIVKDFSHFTFVGYTAGHQQYWERPIYRVHDTKGNSFDYSVGGAYGGITLRSWRLIQVTSLVGWPLYSSNR